MKFYRVFTAQMSGFYQARDMTAVVLPEEAKNSCKCWRIKNSIPPSRGWTLER